MMLTKGHPATDNLRTLLHICNSSYWETPVCHRAPEMLYQNADKEQKLKLRLQKIAYRDFILYY